jgi:integrase
VPDEPGGSPTVANRRPGLARPLESGQVWAMLDACDPGTLAGRRDLAMLTLMARMGLRPGQVAGLRLDDISWRSGEVTVRGKGGRLDRLPLTADAGEAIAAWPHDGRRGAGPGRVHAADGPAAGPDRRRRHHGGGQGRQPEYRPLLDCWFTRPMADLAGRRSVRVLAGPYLAPATLSLFIRTTGNPDTNETRDRAPHEAFGRRTNSQVSCRRTARSGGPA